MSACASCPAAGWSSTERRPSRRAENVLEAAAVRAGGGGVMASHERRTFAQRAVMWLTPAVCAALLVGCTVGPNFKRPPVTVPEAYRGAQALADASIAEQD